MKLSRLPRVWNNGILEGWFLKGYYPFLILPLIQHCIIPEPFIPLFQHSNWGKAFYLPFAAFSRSFFSITQ
jgi:hypothetical protein